MGRLLAGLALTVCLASAFADDVASIDDVKREIDKRFENIQGFRADVSMDATMPLVGMSVPSKGTGSIEMMEVDGVPCFRLEVLSKVAQNALVRDGLQHKLVTVFDGEFEYTEMTLLGRTQVTKRTPNPADPNRPASGGDALDRYRAMGDVVYSGEGEVGGKPVWIIDVKGKNGSIKVEGPMEPERMRLFIAQDSGIQIEMRMFDDKDRELVVMRYLNLELNPELDASRFEYAPPPGVKVQESKS